VPAGLHVLLLRLFGRLPVRLRRAVVRAMTPSFTVGANCVIERDDGDILLVRQVYRKRWGLPGGLLERGEAPADAVVREVAEEVGFTVDLVGEPAVVVDADARRVDVVFRARPQGPVPGELRPCSPEISEARWHRPDALPELQEEAADALVALARSAADDLAARLHGLAGARPRRQR
jgi:ADP-ribose pyrophosphatase YjhB (NUDIX family)